MKTRIALLALAGIAGVGYLLAPEAAPMVLAFAEFLYAAFGWLVVFAALLLAAASFVAGAAFTALTRALS